MWFAALENPESDPWFVAFMARLLQGSPDVLALLDGNPFPHRPPVFVRAMLYDSRFTDIYERFKTGAWWKRDFAGVYFPVRSLTDMR